MKKSSFGEEAADREGSERHLSTAESESKYRKTPIKDGTHEGWGNITFETKEEKIISLTLANGKTIHKDEEVVLTVREGDGVEKVFQTTVLDIFVAGLGKQAQHITGSRSAREMINNPDLIPVIALWVSDGIEVASTSIVDVRPTP